MNTYRTIGDVGFIWDSVKAETNLTKHGVTFDDGLDVFFDKFAINGDASVDDEDRSFTIGRSHYLRALVGSAY